MRCISVHEPWSSLIACGGKRYETRSWATKYRGDLAIHASKRWTAEQSKEACQLFGVSDEAKLPPLPLGAVLCVVELVDCIPTEDLLAANVISALEQRMGNFGPGRYGWLLANVRPLSLPFVTRGFQGLFDVPTELITSRLRGA